jgi:hypothetical protein
MYLVIRSIIDKMISITYLKFNLDNDNFLNVTITNYFSTT